MDNTVRMMWARVSVTAMLLVSGIVCAVLKEGVLAAGLIGAAIGHAPSGAYKNGNGTH